MSDIVYRLRYADQQIDRGNLGVVKALCWEAHLEIGRLRAELAEARNEASELAKFTPFSRGHPGGDPKTFVDSVRAARAAISAYAGILALKEPKP